MRMSLRGVLAALAGALRFVNSSLDVGANTVDEFSTAVRSTFRKIHKSKPNRVSQKKRRLYARQGRKLK